MKLNRSILLGGVALAASLYFVHAQQMVSLSQSAQPVSEVTDEQVMLQAIEQVAPQPASATPNAGIFYTVQHAPGSTNAWPPLPGNVLNLPFWSIGDGFYVLDDRNIDYAALQAAAEAAAAMDAAAQLSPRSGRMSPMMSLISTPGNNQVYLTNLAAAMSNGSTTASFTIAGGTNNFAYDIFSTTNLADSPVYSQWNWLGQGYTGNNYTFTNQPLGNTFYRLALPWQTMVVAWGDDASGQCDVPSGLTNAIDVAGGYNFSLALKADSTVVAWGDNTYGETTVPAGLTNVTSIAAGGAHVLALLQNGTVVAWGDNASGQTNVPAGLTNVTAITAGDACSLALQNDGTIVAWGYNFYGQTNVPALGPVSQIAAGVMQGVALSTNGTVAMWAKYNYSGAPYYWNITNMPAGLSNVVSIAAGALHTLALKADGTVTAWGAGGTSTGLDNEGQAIVPAGLSNVVGVAGGYLYSLALQSAGTVVAWGDDFYGETDMPDGLTGVKAISAGGFHGLAIRSGSLTPVIFEEPVDQYALAGATVMFSAYGEGVAGVSYQWQYNGVNISGATGSSLTLTNVQTTDEGGYRVLISNSTGFVTSDAANLYLVTQPVIVSQAPMPTNQVAVYQTNLSLSVVASAPGQANGFPLGYQWQCNGTNIGGNMNSYSFVVDTNTAGTYSVTVTNAAGSTSAVWQVTMTYAGSYIDVGTLAYHLSTNAVGHTNGISNIYNGMTELSGWIYDTYSGTNLAHLTNSVWSTNFWLKGVQGLGATCIGFSNGFAGQGCVTMISPRHCIYANHMHIPPGQFTAAFLDTNNVIYWRTNMQNVFITDDISVGILDSDLPPSVGFLPVLPTNYASYLPVNGTSIVQGIGMNQAKQLFGEPMTFTASDLYWNSANTAPFGLTTSWNVTLGGGDSSNPALLLVGNQLVLVSHNFGATTGPNYASQIDAINQTMHYLSTNNSVGTDYQLTPFSLTNWPTIH
jgi:hypothetical protein